MGGWGGKKLIADKVQVSSRYLSPLLHFHSFTKALILCNYGFLLSLIFSYKQITSCLETLAVVPAMKPGLL